MRAFASASSDLAARSPCHGFRPWCSGGSALVTGRESTRVRGHQPTERPVSQMALAAQGCAVRRTGQRPSSAPHSLYVVPSSSARTFQTLTASGLGDLAQRQAVCAQLPCPCLQVVRLLGCRGTHTLGPALAA